MIDKRNPFSTSADEDCIQRIFDLRKNVKDILTFLMIDDAFEEQFELVQQIRANHRCTAHTRRFNLFRGKLYCECCGHPLAISKKQLLHRDADIYFCMYHYSHPEVCPKTHRVYHEMLYPYVLQQIQTFAKAMKRRKVNSPIKEYASIEELTPEVLDKVIERIEIGHVTRKSKPGNVIQIYWKLK